ncbi:zinc finger Y-chromosomal protein isoform X2 [Leptinotarsa decemlineata]|uniref:zinc finger Y-chromosomal protein isoform X2 n=1 Tax=Leptinotarsa decemlineata TaxID=7539 RepID=UPI003D30D1EB
MSGILFASGNYILEENMQLTIKEEMDISGTEILCRVCNRICVSFFPVDSRICHFTTTIKDVIVLLVPQMETVLEGKDVICHVCRETLIHCLKFIDKCLRIKANHKDNLVYKKTPEDVSSRSNLEDNEIRKLIETTKFPEQDIHSCRLNNGNYISGIGSNGEGNSDVLAAYVADVLPRYFPNHNRLISAKDFSTEEIDKLISTLASSEIKTLKCFQDSDGSRTKRVILLGSTFKCNKCGKYFNRRSAYKIHLQIHEKVKKYGKAHEKVGNGLQKKKKRETDFKCKTCSKKFPSKEDLKFHIKIHPPYICEKCGKGFANSHLLYLHQIVHNDPNSYICEVCGKLYKSPAQLRVHQLLHKNISHLCDKCPKEFKTANSLRNHLKFTHNEGITRTWTCKECGRVFKKFCVFTAHHRQIHLRDGPLKCDICGQGFGRSDYLKRHKQRHIRHEKKICGPYQCQICTKKFKTMENLKLHIRSHGRLSRFNCKYCTSTFKNKYQRNRHEKLHEKCESLLKYRCKICWRRMKSQEELDIHSLNHDHFKYKCDTCGEYFARKYLLNEHMVNIHVEDRDAEEEYQNLLSTGLGPLYE